MRIQRRIHFSGACDKNFIACLLSLAYYYRNITFDNACFLECNFFNRL